MKRIEEMAKDEQLESLCRLHDILNDGLFDGKLKRAFVPVIGKTFNTNDGCWMSIGRAGKRAGNQSFTALASFHPSPIENICFDYFTLQFLACDYEPEEQVRFIAITLLHEMIHQYCYENGLPLGHGGKFRQYCKAHGLQRITVFNEFEERKETQESLLPIAEKIIGNFRW